MVESHHYKLESPIRDTHIKLMNNVGKGMNLGLRSRADYPRVDAVIKSVGQSKDWDIAATPSDSYFYQLRAAHNVDMFEPFTAEQTVLNNYLAARRAGKRLCDYAWRLYAQSL